MINLKIGKIDKYLSVLDSVTSSDGQYGQEINFHWIVTGHPRINDFYEKFNIGSEQYGEKAFERLSKAFKALTGEEIQNGKMDDSKIIGKKYLLSFGTYNDKDTIAGRYPFEENKAVQPTESLGEALDDEINF